MGLGLQGAYGAVGGRDALRQALMDRLTQQQQTQNMTLQARAADRADRSLNQQDELTRLKIQEMADARAGAQGDKEIGLANNLADQIPPGATLTPTDPAVALLQKGGRGALLTHETPTLASTSYQGTTTAAPGDTSTPMRGTLRMQTNAAKPERYVKTASAKQIDTATDNTRQQEAVTRADDALKEATRHNKAMEARPTPQSTVTIQTVDDKGNPVTRVVPKAEAIGKDFAKPDATTQATRTMAEGAKHVLPIMDKIDQQATDLEKLGLMGPIQGRWRDFVAGKIGAGELAGGNPENAKAIGRFLSSIGLLQTAVARVHGGARGGGSPAMLEHMKHIINADTDLPTFLGEMSGVRDFMKVYANVPDGSEPAATGGGGPAAGSARKFNPQTGKVE